VLFRFRFSSVPGGLYGLLTLLVLAGLPTVAAAQQVVCEGLEGEAAIDCFQENYSLDQTLGYDTARDTMYAKIDAGSSGQLTGVYSGYTITLTPGEDPSKDAYSKDVNAEHVFPQSKGAGTEPLKSDMHNLRPARTQVNSARGNIPFGESPDAQTDTWYYQDKSRTSVPSSNVDARTERIGQSAFEPREGGRETSLGPLSTSLPSPTAKPATRSLRR
jgi:hypothetical protein